MGSGRAMKLELTRERRVAEIFKDAIACADAEDQMALLEQACGTDAGLRAAVEALIAADASGMLFPDAGPAGETQLAGDGLSAAGGLGHSAVAALSAAGIGSARERRMAGTAGSAPAADSIAGYTILREIHRGGQGVVYQALQKSTNRKVAIKVLKEGPFAGPMHRARFEREVQVLGQLGHPNIVTIHDSGSAAGQHYFVMDYIAGQPLDVYMSSGARGIRQTVELFRKICDAVSAAHLKGVIHRDLKPGNICVDATGEPRVLDFGLAKIATSDSDAEAMTVTGQFLGSLPWASPEQAEGSSSKIDLRTDVYSLGVVLYQMLTGRFPYEVVGGMRDVLDRIMTAEPARPRTIRREIDDEVETIVLKCLAKERDRRYQSAGELARDLGRYLDGEPIEAKRDSVRYLLRKKMRRHRAAAAVVLAIVAVGATGFGSAMVNWRRAVRNEKLASENARNASRERDVAQYVSNFLQTLLGVANPNISQDPELRVRSVLDWGAARLEAGGVGEYVEAEVQIRRTIGEGYLGLGLYRDAEQQFAAAAELMEGGGAFGAVDRWHVRMQRALSLLEVGDVNAALGQLRAIEPLCAEIERDDPVKAAIFKSNVAHALGRAGEDASAERLYREAQVVLELSLDRTDLELASFWNRFAVLLRRVGKAGEAEHMMREALKVRDAMLPVDHPERITSRFNLAELQLERGDFTAAEENARLAAEAALRSLHAAHPHYASALIIRGSALVGLDRAAEAEPLLRDCLAIREGYLKAGNWRIASAESALGECLARLGQTDEAEALLSRAAQSLTRDETAPVIRRRETLDRLIALYERAGRVDDAANWKRQRDTMN